MIELTDQQIESLQRPDATPPRVVNPRTAETFVLLQVEEYERLKALENDESPWPPRCSFCGKTADKVGPFVEGVGRDNEGGVFICKPCVERLPAVLAADPLLKETRECLRCHAVIAKAADPCPECGFPRLR
jgi:hypothetical protein